MAEHVTYEQAKETRELCGMFLAGSAFAMWLLGIMSVLMVQDWTMRTFIAVLVWQSLPLIVFIIALIGWLRVNKALQIYNRSRRPNA